MVKGIIFDWAGVIKDSIQSHLWVINRMMEGLGGNGISVQELKENWEQPYMNFWKKYYPDLTLENEQKIYHEVIAREDCPESEAFAGIVELIKKLKRKGFKMVVLSSDPPETIFPEVKRFGLESVFDELAVKVHDKGEVIEQLMRRNGLKKEETVFIGDSNHEVEVGRQAGIKTIAVTWGFCTEGNLKATKPDYLVHSIKELENILIQ